MAKIILKNVRLSFLNVFNKEKFDGVEGKFAATLLIDKSDTETKARLDAAIASALKEADVKVAKDKICLKDGDDIEYDGYAGMWSVKATNSRRPTLLNRDKSPIVEEDGILYSGCYANAIIDIWIQKNQWGRRANANLYGLQFIKDGEPFGVGSEDVTNDFEDLDDL